MTALSKRAAALLPGLLLLRLAAAQDPQPTITLPDPAIVQQALISAPRLQISREAVTAGEAQERRLRAGAHEWEVVAMTQHRTDESGRSYDEQEYGLQRGVRWPWKMALDRSIGAQARMGGELSYADAWHEASRQLLDLWFEWLQAEDSVRLGALQLQTWIEQRDTVRRRVAAGDAARIELQIAEAEVLRLQAQHSTLARSAVEARERLLAQFPGLPLVAPREPDRPVELPGDDALWVARILSDNHEIELATVRAEQARLVAERAVRDRLADPTLALRFSDNLDGNRKVVGVTVTLPLGGALRRADAALARSNARAAGFAEQQARDGVESAARATVAAARLSFKSWQDMDEAARQALLATTAAARGYAQGELDMAALLTLRRQGLEAEQQLRASQLAALRAHARVLLDAHLLWPPPEVTAHTSPHRDQ